MRTRVHSAFAAFALMAIPTVGFAQSIKYDGIFTAADNYATTEIVGWFNSHDSSTYGTFSNQKYKTYIRYGVGTEAGDPSGTKYFYLFAESPLEAKNMVWGSGMTAAEISQYGKQLDYSGATGSEKIALLNSSGNEVLIADIGSNIAGKGKNLFNFGMVSFRDSVDYLIGNGISNTTTSAAHNYTMSVEMKFAYDPVKNAQVVAAARNGLDYHLSPDRGLIPTQVPEPGSALLLGMVASLGFLRRRR